MKKKLLILFFSKLVLLLPVGIFSMQQQQEQNIEEEEKQLNGTCPVCMEGLSSPEGKKNGNYPADKQFGACKKHPMHQKCFDAAFFNEDKQICPVCKISSKDLSDLLFDFITEDSPDSSCAEMISAHNKGIISIDINSVSFGGNSDLSFLLFCATFSRNNFVPMLLAADGIDVNVRDKNGKTALMLAVEFNNQQIIPMLLAANGIDVNVKDNNGKTALMLAVKCNNQQIIPMLLAASGIDVNVRDKEGLSAIEQAVFCNNLKIINMFLSNKIIKQVIDFPALLYAVIILKKIDFLKTILMVADNINVNDIILEDQSAIQLASKVNSNEIVQILSDYEADKNNNRTVRFVKKAIRKIKRSKIGRFGEKGAGFVKKGLIKVKNKIKNIFK
jgi:ankyrin repeat protein